MYDIRGEMVGSHSTAFWGSSAAVNAHIANAINTPFGTSTNPVHSAGWDALMGVLSSSQTGKCVSDGSGGCAYQTTSTAYDTLGRESSKTTNIPNFDSATNDLTWAANTTSYTYDAENQVIAQQSTTDSGGVTTTHPSYQYSYWPSGHVAHDLAYTSTGYVADKTLHWDGTQALFQTNSSGQLMNINVGALGAIVVNEPTNQYGQALYKGITFFWRDLTHQAAVCYNATGYALCSNNTYATPSTATVMTDLMYARPDQLQFAGIAVQGVRAVDTGSNQWLTPDAYAGDVHDPMSQKSYVWNGNNPIAYSDPSGYAAMFYDAETSTGGYAAAALAANDAPDSPSSSEQPPDPNKDPNNGTYPSADAAATAAAKRYTPYADTHLAKDQEGGATIFCNAKGTGCGYGAFQVGMSGEVAVTFTARSDGKIYQGWWHSHSKFFATNQDSLEDHQPEMQQIAGIPGISSFPHVWTSLGRDVVAQDYYGPVAQDDWSALTAHRTVCAQCIRMP